MATRSNKSWPNDIADFHEKFKDTPWVDENPEKHTALMDMRMTMIAEEYFELQRAYFSKDPEEFVDACVDLTYFLVGTLDLAKVDMNKAFDAVHAANMVKIPGVKEGRPNPVGVPDRIKLDDWVAPDHSDNHGILKKFLGAE